MKIFVDEVGIPLGVSLGEFGTCVDEVNTGGKKLLSERMGALATFEAVSHEAYGTSVSVWLGADVICLGALTVKLGMRLGVSPGELATEESKTPLVNKNSLSKMQ